MITLRKLEQLPVSTRGRKLLGLLTESHDPPYLDGVLRLTLAVLGETLDSYQDSPRNRILLRFRLAEFLGIAVADWDLQAPPDRQGPLTRFECSVFLDGLRAPFNVGSVIRTAEAYGFQALYHDPGTPGLEHSRTRRSAMGAERNLPVEGVDLPKLQEGWGHRPVFALELGGVAVEEFQFPQEGLVLLGGEEAGLSAAALAWADGSAGRVSLPLYGRKASLNVGVAFGILAAFWTRSIVASRLA